MKPGKIVCPVTGKEIKVIKSKSQNDYIEALTNHLPGYARTDYLKRIGIIKDAGFYLDEDDDQWDPGFNPMCSPSLMKKLVRGRMTYVGRG